VGAAILSPAAMPNEPRERTQPGLIFFSSGADGRSRRVEAFLAQVLQRRSNHGTFKLYSVDIDEHPELAERFKIDGVPVLVVIQEKREQGRLEKPRGSLEIERFLAPWLQ
jgi:thioredoxin-like negative regulator of GroEL